MQFRAPTSFAQILTDGYMIQAEFDEAWQQATYPIQEIEFQEVANFYQVRVFCRSKLQTFTATRVASIVDGTWYWHNRYRFDIPELQTSQPYHLDLMRAARTLHGSGPAMVVPQGENIFEVIIIDPQQLPQIPLKHSLPLALAAIPEDVDIEAALTAYAAFRGEVLQPLPDNPETPGSRQVMLGDFRIDLASRRIVGAVCLDDLNADAWFVSVEAQYFYEAHRPPAILPCNLQRGRIELGGKAVNATLIGSINDGIFRWAYFDVPTRHLTFASASHEIKRFAIEYQIVELLRPRYAAQTIDDVVELIRAAKPILGKWIHACVQLDAATIGIVLLDDPNLQLPVLSPQVAEAVFANTVPPNLNPHRALSFYSQKRNVPLDATGRGLQFPMATVLGLPNTSGNATQR